MSRHYDNYRLRRTPRRPHPQKSLPPPASLLCITSVDTASAHDTPLVERPRGPPATGSAVSEWASINTVTKTFNLPSSLPCAWGSLPQARAIKGAPRGSALQLVGFDLSAHQVRPYVEEAIRQGMAVRICFVSRGVGTEERRHDLVHVTPRFTVASVLSDVVLDGKPPMVPNACAVCNQSDDPKRGQSLFRCCGCKCTWYCSIAHQNTDWSMHKAKCDKSQRALNACTALEDTFCPLAQYHEAEGIAALRHQRRTVADASTSAQTSGSGTNKTNAATTTELVDTFQLKIRGVKKQIKTFLERQRRRTVSTTDDALFIPLAPPDSTETWRREPTPPPCSDDPVNVQPLRSLCCGTAPHDTTKIIPCLPAHTKPALETQHQQQQHQPPPPLIDLFRAPRPSMHPRTAVPEPSQSHAVATEVPTRSQVLRRKVHDAQNA
eukprot:m.203464 g.203464  ORF g.203464 m.203464 type:complete len:436 (-) comp22133_c0_seq1:84-1391(-)